MIHTQTTVALSLATVGGFLVGRMTADSHTLVALVLAAVVGCAAIFVTPHAETVALEWREKQRVEEEREGSA